MSSKSKRTKKSPQFTLNKAFNAALTIFLWAYCGMHEPDHEEMHQLAKEISSVRDSLSTGRLKLWEIRQALKEEYGWEIE